MNQIIETLIGRRSGWGRRWNVARCRPPLWRLLDLPMDFFFFTSLSFADDSLLGRLSRFQFALLPLEGLDLAHALLVGYSRRVVVVSVRHRRLWWRWWGRLLDWLLDLLFLQSPLPGPFQIFLNQSQHSATFRSSSFSTTIVILRAPNSKINYQKLKQIKTENCTSSSSAAASIARFRNSISNLRALSCSSCFGVRPPGPSDSSSSICSSIH